MMKLALLFLISFNAVFAQYVTEKIAMDFFKAKRLNNGVILGCLQNKKEIVTLWGYLKDFRTRYFNLDSVFNLEAKITLNQTTYHLGVVLQGDCKGANDFLQICGKQKLIGSVHKWLIITENEAFATIFTNVSLHIDSNVHVAVSANDSMLNYIIYDVYNPSFEHGGDLKIYQLGEWSEEGGYNANITINKYWARKNMSGVHFKSAVMIPEQYNLTVEEYLANDSDSEVNSMHRFQSVTVRHCQDMYNFSLDIMRTNSWGYIVPNTGGQFDGLVGLLQRREVDFGCSPLIFKYDRLPVVDYSFGNWILKSVFIYRPPKSSASSYEIFVRPFGRDVWIGIILISTISAIIFKMALRTEFSFLGQIKKAIDTRWSYIVLVLSAAFCLQDTSKPSGLAGGRVLALVFFLFYYLIYQFYSGYIVSYLLMDPPRLINNLADLWHSSLDAGIENILIDKDYFVQTTDPVALDIFNKKAKSHNRSGYYEPLDGLELVKKGGFAYHVQTCTAYPLIRKTFPPKTICQLEEVHMYRTQPMHTNAQKHSPFKEMLNHCMLRLVEHGLMFRLRNHWDARRPECIEADHVIEITVGLEEFNFALVSLLFGCILGLLFLCCEIYTFRRQNRIDGMESNKGEKGFKRSLKNSTIKVEDINLKKY